MNLRNIFSGVIFITVFVVIYFLCVAYFYNGMTERGQFGDMFGGLNTIFSGLAFLGVIYTVVLQHRELALQREELKLTRDELRRSAEAQEASNQALIKQAHILEKTANINGLSARLQHINTLIEVTNSAKLGIDLKIYNQYKKEADDIISRISFVIDFL
jgi:hypothetical protein